MSGVAAESGPGADSNNAQAPAVPENIQQAEASVKANRWDVGNWILLTQHARLATTPIEWARATFESFLSVFPTSVGVWRDFIDLEIKAGNIADAEKLFDRGLTACPDVELFQAYIRYIRAVKKGAADEYSAVTKAFEFTLQRVGADVEAGSMWLEYAQAVAAEAAGNTFQQANKQSRLRKIYQRAVCLPTSAIDVLWKEYDKFEHTHNAQLAKGLLTGIHSRHLYAKQDSLDRRKRSASIMPVAMCVPPSAQAPTRRDVEQLRLWRAVVQYEKNYKPPVPKEQRGANMRGQQQVEIEVSLPSSAKRKGRVLRAYRRALMSHRFRAELWSDAALFLASENDHKAAEAMFREGLAATPVTDRLLLCLFFAEYLELNKQFKKARVLLEGLIKELKAISTPPDSVTRDINLAWIHLMRMVRRCEGIPESKRVFTSALRAGASSWQLYVEGAHLELHTNKDLGVAGKIFKLGYQRGGHRSNLKFVEHYAKFLYEHNDHINLRAVLKAALEGDDKFPAEEARGLWDLFVRFERDCSNDLSRTEEAERKRNAALRPADPETERHTPFDKVQRYTVEGLTPCEPAYRDSLGMLHGRMQGMRIPRRSTAFAKGNAGAEAAVFKTPIPTATLQSRPRSPWRAETGTSSQESGAAAPTRPFGYSSLPSAALHAGLGGSLRVALQTLLPPHMRYKGPQLELGRLMDAIVNTQPSGAPTQPAAAVAPARPAAIDLTGDSDRVAA